MIHALPKAGFNLPVTPAIPPTKPSASPPIQPVVPTFHQLTPGRTTRETLPRPFPGPSVYVSFMCFAVRSFAGCHSASACPAAVPTLPTHGFSTVRAQNEDGPKSPGSVMVTVNVWAAESVAPVTPGS